MKPLIIEVAMNELMPKEANAHVPYGPDEVAKDAVECIEAGASMLHFHARDPRTGEQRWTDDGLYTDAMKRIHKAGVTKEILFYPTYKGLNEASLSHVIALAKDRDARLAIAPLDVGAVLLNKYDRRTKTFANPETGKVYTHAQEVFWYNLVNANGMRPYNGCAEPGHIRHLMAYMDMGLLEEPVLIKYFCSVDGPYGMPPTPRGVQMYTEIVRELAPKLDYEWFVMCYGQAIIPMAAQAIVSGGHIRIGLGDETWSDAAPRPTNADLVRRIATLAKACGREIATPRQAREILGLKAY